MRTIMNAILCFLFVTIIGMQFGAQSGPTKATSPGTSLDGIWQQRTFREHKGFRADLEPGEYEIFQSVFVVSGKESYWIRSLVSNLGIFMKEIQVDAQAKTLDLVNPDNNCTTRCLYELKDDALTICWHARKGVLRPEKIAATADGFVVNGFKKLDKAGKAISPSKAGTALFGLWETVGYELNGSKLEENKLDLLTYWSNRKVYYFQSDCYTLVGTEKSALTVVHKPYATNPKAGKNAIDFVGEKDEILPAIYKMQGDSMSICWNYRGGTRPDQFRTEQDDGRTLIRLKRVDKAK